jgi:adenine phosphoribosyltransferase
MSASQQQQPTSTSSGTSSGVSSSPSSSTPSQTSPDAQFQEHFGILPYADPKRKVIFYNVAPLFKPTGKLDLLINYIAEKLWFVPVTHLLLLEARGFLFGPMIQSALKPFNRHLTLVLGRKGGKLPGDVLSESFSKEYAGTNPNDNMLEINADAIPEGANVVIVDDIIATGGTLNAAIKLVKRSKANVVGLAAMLQVAIPDVVPDFGGVPVFCPLVTNNGVITFPDATPPPKPRVVDPDADQDRRTAIFAMPTMIPTALALSAKHPVQFVYEPIEFNKYADGMPDVRIPPMHRLLGRNAVFFIDTTVLYESLVILSLIKALSEQHFASFTIIMPYFATSRSDRDDGQKKQQALVTGSTFAELLSDAVSITRGGCASIITGDIHALQERFFFGDKLNVRLLTAKNMFVKKALELKATILCPDDGAKKALEAFIGSADCTCLLDGQKLPMMVVSKSRQGDARIIQSIGYANMDAYGPDHDYYATIFGIDDMTSTGSTVIESSKAVMHVARIKCKPGVVPRICWGLTHAFFDDVAVLRRFLPGGDGDFVQHIYTTDTVPRIAHGLAKHHPSKFTCFSMVDAYADFVLRTSAPILSLRRAGRTVVVLTSGSHLKNYATAVALEYAPVSGEDVKAMLKKGICEMLMLPNIQTPMKQPFGKTEIMACLQARMDGASLHFTNNPLPAGVTKCVAVAIENGLVDNFADSSRIVDQAFVRLRVFDRNSAEVLDVTYESNPVFVPAEYVTRIREELAKGHDVTLGDLIHRDHPEIPSDNWHEHFGGVSRQTQILQAFKAITDEYPISAANRVSGGQFYSI